MSCLWKKKENCFTLMEITLVEITASFLPYDANWGPSYLDFFSLYITGSRCRLELLLQNIKMHISRSSSSSGKILSATWIVSKCNYYTQTHNMVI